MRRPSRHGRGVSSTRSFSSFGRSIERVASAKRKPGMLKPHQKDRTESSGDAFTKNKMKQKIVQSGSSSEDEDEKTVQADFSFFDPKPDDFHGVKMLLQNYLDSKQWDLSGFVDLLLGQPTVGTVIKIEDSEDDTPFCIISALNLGRYKDQKCIKEFKDFMLNASPKDLTHNLRMHLEEHPHSVGLLVSQRVVNLPPQLLPPLYDALFDEVSWATEDEPTEELRKSFRFKTYLIATRIYRLKNVNRQKGTSKGSKEDPIIYIKLEDELFLKLSSWSFNFALQTEQLANQELRNYKLTGLVMSVEAEKIPKFRKQLHSLIEEA